MDGLLRALQRHSAERPASLALEEDGLRLTYRDLDKISDQVAHQLVADGTGAGHAVCYLGTSIPRRLVAFVAALKANRPFAVLNPREPPHVAADIFEHSGAAHLVLGSQGLSAIVDAIGTEPLDISTLPQPASVPFSAIEASPSDTAYMLYTSGSSGRPKGVPTSRRIAMYHAFLETKAGGIHAGGRIAALGQVWLAYIAAGLFWGAEIYCFDFASRGAADIPAWMRKHRITYSDGYPAMLRAVMESATAPIEGMRAYLANGEPVLKADIEKFEQVFPGAELAAGYGSSEYVLIARYLHRSGAPFPYAAAPLGEPLDPGFFHLRGKNGKPVPTGEPGEVVMISPMTLTGYHNDPERSAAVFPLDEKTGWRRYHTGDYAYYDAAGVLHSAGRADDQIKIRGYTLRTSDVEQEILGIPGIRKVAVSGFAGPRGIQRLACHFEAEGDQPVTEDTIREHLRQRLPGFMVPGYYIRHDRLPTTANGKILRRGLPNPLEQTERQPDSPATPLEEQIAAIWRNLLGHSDFGRDDDFFDIGGDSLQAMQMLTEIEQQLGKRLPLETLILSGATLKGLSERISALGGLPGASVSLLNASADAPPLVALHVIGGHLSDYLELAHAFSGVRPMLGVGAEGDITRNTGIRIIAERAAGLMQQETGATPAALLGFSAGAAFALETARTLVAGGAPPPRLILLDANCAWLDKLCWLRFAWRAVKTGDTRLGGQRLAGHLARLTGRSPAPRNLDEAHLQALLEHRPEPLNLPKSLLVLGQEGQVSAEERAEWQRLLGGGLEVITVPGDHMSMLRAPNAGGLARSIEDWLRA